MKKLNGKILISIIALLILSLFTVSCQEKKENRENSPSKTATLQSSEKPDKTGGSVKIQIVTTILPLYDIAVNIGGDRAEVHNLLPAGASPHSYAPSVEDSMTVEKADMVLMMGLQLDDWIKKIADNSGGDKKSKIVIVSEGIKTLILPEQMGDGDKEEHENEHQHEHENAEEHHHKAGDVDNHLWMDPVRMKEMARNVTNAFIQSKPQDKDYFEKNYADYAAKLDELDKKYSDELSKFKKKDFVTFHTFLNYTANRYGMNQVAVIATSPGKQPDPKHIAEVVDILKSKGVKVVFAEPQFSPKASELIATEIGGKITTIDPIGSLEDPDRCTYIKNMETNLKGLIEAFRMEKDTEN